MSLGDLVPRRLRERGIAAAAPLVRALRGRADGLPESTWGLERRGDGALALDGLELASLLDRWGSPLHVVDAARLAENAARFTRVPPGARRGCEVRCSYKTNPVPGVLRLLHARGIGAEVVSPWELWLALRLGVDPAAVVYNGPAKSDASLRIAIERGVGLVNANDAGELPRIAAAARAAGRRARTGVRIVVPGRYPGQFGERVEGGAALRAFAEAAALPELSVVALHAHLGGRLASAEELDGFVGGVLAFTDALRASHGIELEVLDLGGNLASRTVSRPSALSRRLTRFGVPPPPPHPDAALSIDAYVARVVERVERHYLARGRAPPRLVLEPGRALMGDAQLLLCRVLGVRAPDRAGISTAVLDAGIHLAPAVRDERHEVFAAAHPPAATRRRYRLFGPSCMQGDLLVPAWQGPGLAPGDALAIMDAGAYLVPFSSPFSFPRPAIAVVDAGAASLLRRRETFEDLVAQDELDGPAGAAWRAELRAGTRPR